jgi:signal transduction histidine kinase
LAGIAEILQDAYSALGISVTRAVIRGTAIAIVFVGLVVSLGWIFDLQILKSLYPDAPTMKFSTSVSFVATGIIVYFSVELLTSARQKMVDFSQLILPPAILTIALFMSVHITSSILGASSGIDNLFVRDAVGSHTTIPGRPAEGTILSFVLIAIAGMVAMRKARSAKAIFRIIGAIVAVIGVVPAIGYATYNPVLYYAVDGISNGMALHTSILFISVGSIVIGLSRILSRPTREAPDSQENQNDADGRFSGVSIRTKFMSILLTVTIIPILFVGGIVLSNAVTMAPELLAGSVAVLGFATIISVLFFALSQSDALLAPLLALRQAIHNVAEGNYGIEIKTESADEIGSLAQDFARMKRAVLETNGNLERLVNERTAELQTSKKQLEIVVDQLREQERMMKQFISVAAHELKNPIAPILMASQLFAKREVENKITLTKDELNLILQNALRLKALCEDILDVARIENNGITLEKQEFKVSDLAQQMISDLKPTLKPGVNIVFAGQEESVEADRDKVQQVMLNLLQNAIKFTKEGLIEISVISNSNSELVVSVKDTGNGIDQEILPKLFSKYATKSEKGTGLGLYISKNIIEAHGGRIWAENNAHKGAKFAFSLPIRPGVVETAETA